MNRSIQLRQPQLRIKYLVEDYNQMINTCIPLLKAEYMIPDYREVLNELLSPKRSIKS